LLEEQRTALIRRVGTRGLHPDATMKPSGQECRGGIPMTGCIHQPTAQSNRKKERLINTLKQPRFDTTWDRQMPGKKLLFGISKTPSSRPEAAHLPP